MKGGKPTAPTCAESGAVACCCDGDGSCTDGDDDWCCASDRNAAAPVFAEVLKVVLVMLVLAVSAFRAHSKCGSGRVFAEAEQQGGRGVSDASSALAVAGHCRHGLPALQYKRQS